MHDWSIKLSDKLRIKYKEIKRQLANCQDQFKSLEIEVFTECKNQFCIQVNARSNFIEYVLIRNLSYEQIIYNLKYNEDKQFINNIIKYHMQFVKLTKLIKKFHKTQIEVCGGL